MLYICVKINIMDIKFEKGVDVICSLYGVGRVSRITDHKIYPLHIKFEDGDENDFVEYTIDGRSIEKGDITLNVIK